MSEFYSIVAKFVADLFLVDWPPLGVPIGVVCLGLWGLYAVGKFVISLFYGDYPDETGGD